MGKFQDKLDAREAYMIAKVDVELWLSEFVLEYSRAGSHYDKIQVIKRWFGS